MSLLVDDLGIDDLVIVAAATVGLARRAGAVGA